MTPLNDYYRARKEHAWLLRAEGKSFAEIGRHLGIGKQTAKQNVDEFSRMMRWAMRNIPQYRRPPRLWFDDSYIDD